MAHFHRVPGGQRISGTTIVVNGDTLTVGLWGPKDFEGNDLLISNEGDDLAIIPAGKSGESALYTIRVKGSARATHAGLSDTILAVTQGWQVWDRFKVDFRFKAAPAGELVVRDVTSQVFGRDQFLYMTPRGSIVDMNTFLAGDPRNVFDFRDATGRVVTLRVYAAKLGDVERSYWLMLPGTGAAKSLMIVISHGFGQNDAYYSRLGYSDPFSKPFLEDVRDRFVLSRWGMQVAFMRADMGLLLPLRARSGTGGGTELGPFVNQAGLGARIVRQIAALAHSDFLLMSVDVVTFSSGIYDANTFIASGGKGLPFRLMINQDPSHGTLIASGGGNRKQYLSGWTTGGPRGGFEYMPIVRWKNDPQYAAQSPRLGREYLHTWALPTYTLAMALSR